MRTGGLVIVLSASPTACDEPVCADVRTQLRSRYEPYGDRCDEASQCLSGSCDMGRTGACKCDADSQCRSALCLDGLCANPDHDRRLSPALGERGEQVQPLCPGVSPAARRQSPDCADVLFFLEKAGCAACDSASLILCACRSGGALHACLIDAAAAARASVEDELADAQTRLCEDQARTAQCRDHLGPIGAQCGDAQAGRQECQSGLCRDVDTGNNASEEGDHPLDWVCLDACATDSDCPQEWICDLDAPLFDAPTGYPHMCRKRP